MSKQTLTLKEIERALKPKRGKKKAKKKAKRRAKRKAKARVKVVHVHHHHGAKKKKAHKRRAKKKTRTGSAMSKADRKAFAKRMARARKKAARR